MINPSNRIVVIGAGNVGSSIAYSLLNQQISSKILLIDIIKDFVEAQAIDMNDSSVFLDGRPVKYGDYSDIMDGDIIIITSGVPQKEDQTRLDLIDINAAIIKDVVKEIKSIKKEVYIIVVSNPVDVLTYIAIKQLELPEEYVFGSGTLLDSGRLRLVISEQFKVNPIDVQAFVMGEHGDTSFPVLSSAMVAGVKLSELCNLNEEYYSNISEKVRQQAYKIIKGKKSTYYGIGTAVAQICKAIINDESRVLSVCTLLKNDYSLNDLALGAPAFINSKGAKIQFEIKLNENEKLMMKKSAEVIKSYIQRIKL